MSEHEVSRVLAAPWRRSPTSSSTDAPWLVGPLHEPDAREETASVEVRGRGHQAS